MKQKQNTINKPVILGTVSTIILHWRIFTNKDNYDENFGARFHFLTNKVFIGNKILHKVDNNELLLDSKPYLE